MQLGSTELLLTGNRSRQREEKKKVMMKGRKEQAEKIGSTYLMEDKAEPRVRAQHSVHRGDDQDRQDPFEELSLTCKYNKFAPNTHIA